MAAPLQVAAEGLTNPFFAFDTGTGRGVVPVDEQAALLDEFGYAGIGYTGTAGIPEMLQALDKRGLQMFSIYVGAMVGNDGPSYDPQLKSAIEQLKGRQTLIWLTIRGGKASSTDFDDQAVQVLQEIGDLAKQSGVRVALYPHTGFYVARVEDAIRLARKTERDNVGASFNLCHWLKLDDEKNMDSLLEAVLPHLFVVSINGADRGDTRTMGWDRLIQTLDRGDFDVQRFLTALNRLGYDGPIGLQCYAIKGDIRDNLQRSMAAWRALSNAARGDSEGVLVTPPAGISLQIAATPPAGTEVDQATHLVEIDEPDIAVPIQWTPAIADDGSAGCPRGRLLATLPSRDGAQGARRFRLVARESAPAETETPFRFEENNDTTIQLLDADQPVLAYNHGVITREDIPETDRRRRRACYIHPVWGLNGEVLTDDFPRDHYHHHGIFWTWPHVQIDGQEYDLWADRGIEQRFVRWICREAGPAAAVLAVENGWFVGDQMVMTERVWMRVFRVSGTSRVLDLEFAWMPIEKPLTLWGAPGKSYGGLTVRFAVTSREDVVITVPQGKTAGDLKEANLPWADLTHPFEGSPQASGAAVFIHPQHPDYPPTWLTRHYGPLCVGWPGVQSRTFDPGTPIRTSYRIWIHQNKVELADLEQAYAGYVAAANVKWE